METTEPVVFEAELTSVKINRMHPEVTVLVLEVPEIWREVALRLARKAGEYMRFAVLNSERGDTGV